MCPHMKDHPINESSGTLEDSESDSDVSMSDSSDSSGEETLQEVAHEDDDTDIDEETQEEEPADEEDPVIKAIRAECEKERDHPPEIKCEDFITSICFHPQNDVISIATIVGDVLLYKYANEENTLLNTFAVHTKACRDLEFCEDGKALLSCGKDKAVMFTDVESGNFIRFFEDAHKSPVNCVNSINGNIFASGDDDGCVKLWDIRQNQPVIFSLRKNEDMISDLINDEAEKYLLCSSGDGSLTTIDLHTRKFLMQSEEYDEELTCLGLFRSETKLLAGSSKGKLFLYNWNEFGLHSDAFPGPKTVINDMIPITENIVVTACEDGHLRAAHLFPHRYLGIVGMHDFSVENVDICTDGQFIASSGHSNEVKFWNIKYFEDFDKLDRKHSKHNKKKDLKNNLPSSKMTNASDFFSGLC